MQRVRGKLSYSNVIATLALVLAVGGGTAYAASAGGSSTSAVKLCAAKKSGDLRLLEGRSCKAGEQELTVLSSVAALKGGPGPTGPVGPAGVAGTQSERGPQGVPGPVGTPTSVASPDGHFTVAATNSGIVLTGPKGSLYFDGERLAAEGNLEIVAQFALNQSAGTTYSLTTGGAAVDSIGGSFTQLVGGGYEQDVANKYKQRLRGDYEGEIDGKFEQRVGSTYKVGSGGNAVLSSPKLQLGGETPCALAARVGSEIDPFNRVSKEGSSKTVTVC